MNRSARVTATAVLAAGAALTGGTAQAAPGEDGLLRLAHLSPDTPAVDVYVDSVVVPSAGITLEGVDYGTISEYQDVPTGSYTVSMREAGASPDTPPVLSTTVEVTGETARTVAGVGNFADLGLEIIDDSLDLPPTGQARVRVLAGASNAETLDIALPGSTTVVDDLAFAATSEYVDVPAGSTTLQVAAGDESPVGLPVAMDAGAVYSLLVLNDESGGLTVTPVLDAASPGVVPAGGVETGAGGTARTDTSPGMLALAGGAIGAALLVAGRGRLRRPRHAAPSR